MHRVTAAAVAGISPEEVTKIQRERAKATNFGIMYGLSAFGLSEQVDIPVDEAKAFIEAYFAKYPRVKEFRERVVAQAAQDGYVTTLFGRRRAVPELHSRNYNERSLGERLAVNTVLQGTAADIIKVAMVRLHRELDAPRHGLAARAAGARRAHPGVLPTPRWRRAASCCARSCAAPTRWTRRSRWTSASDTTGWRPRAEARSVCAAPHLRPRPRPRRVWIRTAPVCYTPSVTACRGPQAVSSVNDGPFH